jgi:glycerol 3-phosphatase-2
VVLAAVGADAAGDPSATGDDLDGLRALAVAHWARVGAQARPPVVRPGDDAAMQALASWGLDTP